MSDREVHPISGSSLRKALTRSEFVVHGEQAIGAELWNRGSVEYPEIYTLLLKAYKTYAEENNIIEPTSPFRLVEPENPKPLK